MYNGIGLQTARGSGTNGYVQANKFFVRPRSTSRPDAPPAASHSAAIKKPDKGILDHDRKRQVQLRLLLLSEALADQGYTEAEIAQKVEEAKKAIEAEDDAAAAAGDDGRAGALPAGKRLSDTQTHQVAARKEKQMETLKAAFALTDGPSKHRTQAPKQLEKACDLKTDESDDVKHLEQKEDLKDGGKLHAETDSGRVEIKDRDNGRRKKQTVEGPKTGKYAEKDEKECVNNKSVGGRHRIDGKHHGRIVRKEMSDVGSDSERSENYVEGEEKRHGKSNPVHSESESDIGSSKKNEKRIPEKEKKHNRRHSSYASDYDSDAGKENTRNEAAKYAKKWKRYDSDSGSDDSSDSDRSEKYVRREEKRHRKSNPVHSESKSNISSGKKSRRGVPDKEKKHNQTCDDDASDYASDSGKDARRKAAKYSKKWRRYHSDSDSDSDRDNSKKQGTKYGSREEGHRLDSKDLESEQEKKFKRTEAQKHSKPGYRHKTSDCVTDHGKVNARAERRYETITQKLNHAHVSRDRSERDVEKKKDNYRRKRHHDTHDGGSDADSGKDNASHWIDRKCKRHDTDSD